MSQLDPWAISLFLAFGSAVLYVAAQIKLAHAATHDSLTDLPNRPFLRRQLGAAIARARGQQQVVVLLVGLDGFKEINDTLGHPTGDRVLKEVAARLRQVVRTDDVVARIGGDEFAVMLGGITDPVDAEVVARRISTAVHSELEVPGRRLYLNVSVGISAGSPEQADAEALLAESGMALHAQKDRGGAGVMFFSTEMRTSVEQRALIKTELEGALEREELFLCYQPIVDAKSEAVSGMEVLLRWRHPRLGLVSPAVFIPVAEATGLIVSIGHWVLRTACAQARAWERQGLAALPISVNMSAHQLRAPHLADMVLSVLSDCNLPPDRLVLEVTESAIMENEEHAAKILDELHTRGVRISIDDFGTGYSSLARLRELPIHAIKIDRSFVKHLPGARADTAIVRAIVAMAHSLELKVVAEGVETREQLATLRALDQGEATGLCVDQIQGFLFSRPLDRQSMRRLLKELHALPAPPASLAPVPTRAAVP